MRSLRFLRAADHRVMPWKNGLGTTTEIAVWPPGAGLDDFAWRVSIADLGASGPFSTFPGCDRVLVQIDGAPMTLSHEGRAHRLRPFEPYRFAGELDTHGALEAPPARDLNVMVRRDRASAEVVVHHLAAGEALRLREADTTLALVLRGAASVNDDGDEARTIGAGEALIAEGAAGVALAARESAVVAVIAVGPAGRYV